jgi:hypothetical protein
VRIVSLASLALALAGVAALPTQSQAAPINTVLDFNSAPAGTFASLVVGDFTFSWVGFGDQQQVSEISAGNNALLDSIRQTAPPTFGAAVTMSLTGGGTFTVTQFDIINLTNPAGGGGHRVDFGGVSYFSAKTQTVLRNDLVDVTSVMIDIVSSSSNFAVDNIHVTYDGPTPPTVPEPATLSLVGLGTLGMAYRARRRKQGASGPE